MADTDTDKPAIPLTEAGADFAAQDNRSTEPAGKASGAIQALRDGAGQIGKQATDRARTYAEDSKARAGGALDEFAKLVGDAAPTVDERLGEQYGKYARSAADQISGFAETLRTRNVDDLVADARDFVKKSPVVAIGAAAAIGFALARLVKSGIEADNGKDGRSHGGGSKKA